MRVIYKRVGHEPSQMIVPNDLKVLQMLVDGYVEAVKITTDMSLLCNEEALGRNLPYNCFVCGHAFFGDLILVGTKGDKFTDCPMSMDEVKEVNFFEKVLY